MPLNFTEPELPAALWAKIRDVNVIIAADGPSNKTIIEETINVDLINYCARACFSDIRRRHNPRVREHAEETDGDSARESRVRGDGKEVGEMASSGSRRDVYLNHACG